MERHPELRGENPPVDPIRTAIVHAVLVAGFLLVHFGVTRLW